MIRTPIDLRIIGNQIDLYIAELKTPYSFSTGELLNVIKQCVWLTGAKFNNEPSLDSIAWATSKNIAVRAYDRRVDVIQHRASTIIKVDNIPVFYDSENANITLSTLEKVMRSIFSSTGLDYAVGITYVD